MKQQIHKAMLRAWLRYHKNATPQQIADANKRIAKLVAA